MGRPLGRTTRCATWVLVGIGSVAGIVHAQVQLQIQLRGQRAAGVPDQASEGAHLPSDRVLSRGLRKATESISAGDFSQALRFLDEVLAADEDSFVATDERGGFVGLKEAAGQLIRDLPPAGRDAYLAMFGPVAERELSEAIAQHDQQQMQRVAARYFYTPAGLEAAYLGALHEADGGRHLAAALALSKLRETPAARERFEPELSLRAALCWLAIGERDKAEQMWQEAAAAARGQVRVAGEARRLGPQTATLDWLHSTLGVPLEQVKLGWENWLAYRRDASRSAHASGGLPHMRERWKVRLLHPQLAPVFESLASDWQQSAEMPPVASAPLAIGDVVLIRTPHQLLAVDFRTGKRIWQVEVQPPGELDELIQQSRAAAQEGEDQQAMRGFAERMWQDYLYQVVSSDGQRVFVVGDLDLPNSEQLENWPGRFPLRGGELVETNRLSAFELATQGKRVWEIDGASARGELAGAFFLGAPTCVGNMLYALVEIKGGIFLAALDAASGDLAWKQQLAGLEFGVALNPQRRLQALMPSYEAGVLVCPTSAGVVVGVDLASRSLAWAYRYDAEDAAPWQRRSNDDPSERPARWLNPSPTISASRVLLTPPESDQLHCLELRSGKLLWQRPRGDMRYVAGVSEQAVVLAGARSLTALRLDDGQPAWSSQSVAVPDDAVLSGMGFANDTHCFLPLSTAEVVAMNLQTGRIDDRARARDQRPLGNLISHRGALLSHNGLSLDRYDQIELLRQRVEQRLAEAPQDVEALRTLGEMAYNEGRLDEAVEALERAFEAAPNDYEVRNVLTECLLAALDRQFAAYRDRLPLLEELLADLPSRRAEFLRVHAEGLLATDEPAASAGVCLQLLTLEIDADQVLELGPGHQALARRWAQAHLAAVWKVASAAQRTEIATQVEQYVASVEDKDSLVRQLAFFADLPIGDRLKLRLAREAIERGLKLAPQLMLLNLEQSDDDAIRREAIARNAALLSRARQPRLAIDRLRQLGGPLADEACVDGMTGAACEARWGVRSRMDWPHGRVDVSSTAPKTGSTASRVRTPQWGVRLERCDDILGRCSVLHSVRSGEVVVRDSYGRELFRAPLEGDRRVRYPESNTIYGVSRGSLLIVSNGRQLAAFNTLASDGVAEPPVLWRASVTSRLEGRRIRAFMQRTDIEQRPGSYRAPRVSRDGDWIGVIGPVHWNGCVYQDQRELVCVAPLTGQVQWSRRDLPAGCDLFGDDQLVFATLPDSTETRVFSAADGRQVGVVQTPPWHEQLVARGSQIAAWKSDASAGCELSCYDAATETTLWRHVFQRGARVDVAEARYVLAAEPSGMLTIIDLVDGTQRARYQGPAMTEVEEAHLLAGSDEFIAVVRHPRRGNSSRNVKSFIPVDYPVIDGFAVCFSRTTGLMTWNRPAEIDQQALMLTQPVDLPLLAFLGTIHSPQRGTRSLLSFLAIDKATGRTLYQTDELPPSGGGLCELTAADDETALVRLETASRTLQLRFTEEPRPPLPPALAEVEAGATRSSRGLMGILENGILENMRRGR